MFSLEAAKAANDNAKILAHLTLNNVKQMKETGQVSNEMTKHWTSAADLEEMEKDLSEALQIIQGLRHPNR